MTRTRDTLSRSPARQTSRPPRRSVVGQPSRPLRRGIGEHHIPTLGAKLSNRSSTAHLPLSAAACLLLGGCASSPQPIVSGVDSVAGARAAVIRETEVPARAEAVTPGAVGLEVRWWVVDDAGEDFYRIAAAHNASLDFLDEAIRDELTASGFRLLRAPMTSFSPLVRDLSISRQISTDWLGQSFRWTGVMAGPWIEEDSAVRIGERRLVLPQGRFDLALRTWIVPTGREPYLHLELLPRYEPIRERTLTSLASDSQRRRPVLESHSRLRLERGYVYLLTAEAPSIDWLIQDQPPAGIGEKSVESDNEEEGDAMKEEQAYAREEAPLGPPTPVTPSVGQLLLQTRVAAGMPGRGRRAVAVLLPHLPAEASLLP